jgi:hypothetical protein
VTWKNISITGAGNNTWAGVAASRTASDTVILFALQEVNGLFITFSGKTDGGGYWTNSKIDSKLENPKWSHVACSSDGEYVAVALNGGGIYVSADHGTKFTKGACC